MFALLTFASTEGAETSKAAFYVTGLALTAFAVIVATLGIVRHDFPTSRGAARGVMTVGTLLVVATMASAVLTA